MSLRFAWILLVFVSCVRAASPHKEVVEFSLTNDVGDGNSVFVVGNHPDLGAGDVTRAVKLRWTSGNVWTGQIAIQAGTQLQYRYIRRSTTQSMWCNASNTLDLTSTFSLSVPSQPPAPYTGKTIYYLSGWNPAHILYNNGGNFVSVPMANVGPGRAPGEFLHKISGLGEAGENFEFVFHDSSNNYDDPPGGGNYLTRLDVFQVQNGNVYSYQPPPVVSEPTLLTIAANTIVSHAPNIPSRTLRVYLPRGYVQNTTRRYPVVYFHDGQNVFDPDTAYLNREWQADETATREISQGRMREAILVGIYNTSARIPRYMPPTDSYPPPPQQGTQGRADAYASYVINDVRPYINNNYRTLSDAKNTLTLGSSMGGLVSLYFGREFSTFGKIAVMSPALWTAPNYVTQVNSYNGTKKPLRVHLDMGTNEGQSFFNDCLSMYNTHLAQDYAANGDVEFVAGCGHDHDEPGWRARLPQVLDYLLPAREDPPELAQRDYPPKFSITSVDLTNNTATFDYTGLFGFAYEVQNSTSFSSWDPVSTTPSETLPWANRQISNSPFPAGLKMFWRLGAQPVP